MAAYLDINVSRARFAIISDWNQVVFMARAAGGHMDGVEISISPGQNKESCTLTIMDTSIGLKEVWLDLPREAKQFAAIVNGKEKLPEGANTYIVPKYLSLMNGSSQVIVLEQNAVTIPDGSATRVTRGSSCTWISNAPGHAYYFDGNKRYLTEKTRLDRFATEANFTLEAWVNPRGEFSDSRLIHYNGKKFAHFVGLENIKQDMGIYLQNEQSVSYPLPRELVDFKKSFTVECWVKVDKIEDGNVIYHVSKDESNFMQLHTFDQSTKKIQLTVSQGGKVFQKSSNSQPIPGTWYHVASVWDSKRNDCFLYIDGQEQYQKGASVVLGDSSEGFNIGSRVSGDATMYGTLDEIRIWRVDRSISDIRDGRNRRAFKEESGLVAHYTFPKMEALDLSGNGYHGSFRGSPSRTAGSEKLCRYNFVAGVSAGHGNSHEGQCIIRSFQGIDAEHWNHVALTFSQSFALRFDGANNYLNCGNSFSLDIIDDFTVEVYLKLSHVNRTHGILSMGQLGYSGQNVPLIQVARYVLLSRTGKVRFKGITQLRNYLQVHFTML